MWRLSQKGSAWPQSYKCDHCQLRHHASCEKISDEIYTFFSQHDDEESLHWFCKKCSILFRRIGSTVQKLEEAHRRLEEKVDFIADRLDKTNKATVQEKITTVLSDKIREDKEEKKEQLRRRTNNHPRTGGIDCRWLGSMTTRDK